MPRVMNFQHYHENFRHAVRIDRQTKWGNPFVMGPNKDGSREIVIAKYRTYLSSSPDLLDALPELAGKDLICWCAPLPCHGDILLALANGEPDGHV